VYGEYELLLPEDEQVFAYTRTLDDDELLVALNFSDRPAAPDLPFGDADLLVANYEDETPENEQELRPYEARVYRR
jgi:glycosidase